MGVGENKSNIFVVGHNIQEYVVANLAQMFPEQICGVRRREYGLEVRLWGTSALGWCWICKDADIGGEWKFKT